MLDALVQDVKYAFRQMVRKPGSAIVTLLVLALGIGANVAIFSMVHGVLFKPLPFKESERLMILRQRMPAAGVEDLEFSPPEIRDYRDQSKTLEAVAEYHSMWFTLLGQDEPKRVQTGVVSANYFDLLGVDPVVGRSFRPEDAAPGSEPVLLLTHEYWLRELGGDPGAVGQTVEMNDKIHTIIGILPPLPPYPDANQVYMTISACPFRSAERVDTSRSSRMLKAFARLDPAASLEQGREEVGVIASRLLAGHPETYADGEGYDATLITLEEELIGDARGKLTVLFITVALVLVITCANLANLSFARLVRREKELAIRSAMGAGQRRLMHLLIIESLVLAFLGGAIGLVFALTVHDLLVNFASSFTTRAGDIGIDATVLLFALAVATLTGLAIGALPALFSRKDLFGALRQGGTQATTTTSSNRLRGALLVVELAVSFVLLIGAGLMVRSLLELRQVDAGFEADRVLTVNLSLNWTNYSEPADRRTFFSQVVERIKALPGVESAALGLTFPLNDAIDPLQSDFEIQGASETVGRARPRAEFRIASPGYFETAGIPVLSGRDFSLTDSAEAPLVAIVNRSLARQYWDGAEVLGHRISLDRGQSWITIVGVVGDVKQNGLDRDVPHEIYLPYDQRSFMQMSLLVRTQGDPMQSVGTVREVVHEIDPEQPVAMIRTLDQMRHRSLAAPRLITTLLSLFALLALVISAVGLGGLLAYSVNQKRQEIGLRMALGASYGQVLVNVLHSFFWMLLIGLALGAAGAFWLSKLMSSLLFRVEPTDLATFVVVGLILLAISCLACLIPALRATRVDPATALRGD